jgi:23S rRNA (guanine2445-N2)-methyltransferase
VRFPGADVGALRGRRRALAFVLQSRPVRLTRAVVSQRPHAPPGRFFATAAKGTERLLESELVELGVPEVRAARGGVYFGQRPVDAYRACLWSRIAVRVHETLATFPCRDGDDLYAGVESIDWLRYLDGTRTLAIRATGQNERLTHTHFIALRAKDAIVDQLRARRGNRPSVDRDDPDLLLFVRVHGASASVSLDYAGASLHARGHRVEEGAAPLRETLAAALVRFSGWDGRSPLVDPMCGSGMLLIEAGSWAARRAPGLARERFGFERWSSFDDSARREIERLRGEARAAEGRAPPLFGSDADPRALEQCRANAAHAGLELSLERRVIADVTPRERAGGLVANPPYGERLERVDPGDFDALLERFDGHQRGVIVPRGFPSRLRASHAIDVYNGPIECELRRLDAAGAATTRAPATSTRSSGPRSTPPQPSPPGSTSARSTAARSTAPGSSPSGSSPRQAAFRPPPSRPPAPRAPAPARDSAPPGARRLSFRPKKDPQTGE